MLPILSLATEHILNQTDRVSVLGIVSFIRESVPNSEGNLLLHILSLQSIIMNQTDRVPAVSLLGSIPTSKGSLVLPIQRTNRSSVCVRDSVLY